jgi:hypothetical protein
MAAVVDRAIELRVDIRPIANRRRQPTLAGRFGRLALVPRQRHTIGGTVGVLIFGCGEGTR